MARKFFMGVCHPRQRFDLMKQAGVEWLRVDAPFPFEGNMGSVSESFRGFAQRLRDWGRQGFKVMGVTPYPCGWQVDVGELGSPKFLGAYEEACRFMANELAEVVLGWQICNELNLEMFRRPLTEQQAIDYAKRGGAGVKIGNPNALVGVNMAGFGESALRMYEQLYPNDTVELDYVGTDGYFGSWEAGGPENWPEKLALLHERTKKSIIVQEFGYSSSGEVMTAEEKEKQSNPHQLKKWRHGWREGHTPEIQAEYLEMAYQIFIDTPTVLGAIWYCWSDHERCWQCGAPDCPCETAWGLADLQENPKPAYHTFAKVSEKLKSSGQL